MKICCSSLLALAFWSFLTTAAFAAEDIVVADFEQGSYAPWTTTGEAFGSRPANGGLPGQMGVEGFKGQGLVNSFHNGDDSTGALTSPEFQINRKYIGFLIGGGKRDTLALQLLVDNKVVRTATGPNSKPGGSEALAQESWDVSDLAGQSAVIRIIDEAKGGWGHINVDHIVLTDTKPKGLVNNVERTLAATTNFLHIPIKNGAPKRSVTLLVDGKPIVENSIELADSSPDWWAPMEISQWKGQTLTLRVDKLHEESQALSSIQQSDFYTDSTDMYREPLRGQFHFSPRRGWNNDPNGCVYYNGEYHLFFQHNPYGWGWGNMHWGHAVSKDLVHWTELSEALLPDDMGPMYSGSAVVDWNNTSGFGKDGQPPLVLFYTAAGSPTVQGMAYSNDGRTFHKYEGNPIIKEVTDGNRDPKVFWHDPSKQWVLILYVEWKGKHTMHFYNSPDLKDWELTSIVQGDAPGSGFLYECPDFFELLIDGDASRKRWVLLGANTVYGLGEFDGQQFHADSMRLPSHRGKGFYAPQSFNDTPDGRRIFIGWWQTQTPGMAFNQSMSLPIELKLTQTVDGPRMTFTPLKELETLRTKTHQLDVKSLKPDDQNPLKNINAELVELRIDFEPADAKQVVLIIRDVLVEYDVAKQELIVAGHRAPAPLRNGRQRLTIYCDRTGLEIFASDGLCYIPMPINLNPESKQLRLESRGGTAKIHSLEVHELRSAWNTNEKE
jgi:fructan beta-fructosidase